VKYFIGLKFEAHFLQFKKIDSFRRRFDSKYRHGSPLLMALVPPFSLEKNHLTEEFLYDLEDEIDSQFLGLNHLSSILFEGIDILRSKKDLLYLRPEMPDEFFYLQQSVINLLKTQQVKFKKPKVANKIIQNGHACMLPLGRFDDGHELSQAISSANQEFSTKFNLKIKDISLYVKSDDTWIQKAKFFEFEESDKLEEMNFSASV